MGEHVVRTAEGTDRSHLEAALARNEFVLFYQPKVDLRDGRVVGAEALIRWQHPERGLLSPASFLPIVDRADLAAVFGRWVLANALAQAAEWRRLGLDMPVSVNVATSHLCAATFVEDVRTALVAFPELGPGALELEVKEAAAGDDVAGLGGIIDACRPLGVRFAIDNFGTGQASVADVRDLRVDTIKIDQSFVRNLLDDANDQSMVEAIIGLARAFRRQVVAEGIEAAAHCVALINLGCPVGQGFGIARPMPAEELAHWLARRPGS